MKAVFIRDLKGHISSAAGIMYSFVFLVVSGLIFTEICIDELSFNFTSVFEKLARMQIILAPLLLVGSFSEENKTGSSIMLLSSPISFTEIIMGKFFAAFCYLETITLVTLMYLPLANLQGVIGYGEVILIYIAFSLLGAVFVAVCEFVAGVSSNATTAYIAGVIALSLFLLIEWAIPGINAPTLVYFIKICSPFSAFGELSSGIFSLSAVIRLISITALFLYLTRLVLEMRYRTGRSEWHD